MYNKTRKKLTKYQTVSQLISEYEGLLKHKKQLEMEIARKRNLGMENRKSKKPKNDLVMRPTANEQPRLKQSSRNQQQFVLGQHQTFQYASGHQWNSN